MTLCLVLCDRDMTRCMTLCLVVWDRDMTRCMTLCLVVCDRDMTRCVTLCLVVCDRDMTRCMTLCLVVCDRDMSPCMTLCLIVWDRDLTHCMTVSCSVRQRHDSQTDKQTLYRPNEHVVGNVVKMTAIFEPRSGGADVISCTLALHLHMTQRPLSTCFTLHQFFTAMSQ